MDASRQLTDRGGMSFTTKSLIGLAAGFGGGVLVHAFGIAPLARTAELIEPAGTMWVNALRMIVIPLVLSNLVLGIADQKDGAAVGRTGGWAFGLFFAFLLVGTGFALLSVPALLSFTSFDPSSLGATGVVTGEGPAAGGTGFSLGQWLLGLVPKNPFESAANGDILQLLVFTILVAFAVTRVPETTRRHLLTFVRGVCETMFVVLRWVLWFTPFGVFVLTFAVATRAGVASVGAVGYFIVLVSALLFVFTLAVYPATVLFGGMGLRRFMQGVAPAQTVAVGTRSSLASLPALLKGAEERLRLPAATAGLVLPLAVSTFKVNTSISSTTKFLFLCGVYGLELSPERVLTFVTASLMLSFSSPGIPTTPGSVSRLPAYLAAGIPIEGVMILSAVDAIPDIFKTLVNVTADMSVAVMVTRATGGKAAIRAGELEEAPARTAPSTGSNPSPGPPSPA